MEELCDMKTAISEAVTNCIVHAYAGETDERKKKILLKAEYFDDGLLSVTVRDYGCLASTTWLLHAAHVFRCEQRGTQRYGIFDHAVLYG